jgi:hypothetical protein
MSLKHICDKCVGQTKIHVIYKIELVGQVIDPICPAEVVNGKVNLLSLTPTNPALRDITAKRCFHCVKILEKMQQAKIIVPQFNAVVHILVCGLECGNAVATISNQGLSKLIGMDAVRSMYL